MPLLGGWSACWSAIMRSNSRNVKLPFFLTRCLYLGGRSASMSFNSRNLKLPFFATICLYWGVNLPVYLPNMSSQTFRCAHHRGLFASPKTNKWYFSRYHAHGMNWSAPYRIETFSITCQRAYAMLHSGCSIFIVVAVCEHWLFILIQSTTDCLQGINCVNMHLCDTHMYLYLYGTVTWNFILIAIFVTSEAS